MPNWKKLITSGSDARLNSLVTDGPITGSAFSGDGSGLTNLSVSNLGSAILENAFDEDTNGDLMPSNNNSILSVFYELDDNSDLMPRA